MAFSDLTAAEWAIAGSVLLLVFVSGPALLHALRPRRTTLYVLNEERGVWENYESPTKGERPQAAASEDREAAIQPETDKVDEVPTHEGGGMVDREIATLSITPESPLIRTADWARDRELCPCCEYPGVFSFGAVSACVLCDWETPLSESPGRVVSHTEWESALADARLSYQATGSALPATGRTFWMVPLTEERKELREDARTLFDYLRTGDRPDTSEVLEKVDSLLVRLRDWGELDPRAPDDE